MLRLARDPCVLARRDVHSFRRLAQPRDRLGEQRQQLRVGLFRRLARCETEQHGAYAEQRGEIGRIELAHPRTVARHDLDEAAALEQPERLAHRTTAHGIGLGEFFFLESGARRVVAIHDAMAEMVGDLLRQGQRADRRRALGGRRRDSRRAARTRSGARISLVGRLIVQCPLPMSAFWERFVVEFISYASRKIVNK